MLPATDRPKPRKRIEPEFPSLPKPSFTDIQQFAHKSQLALPIINTNLASLYLPLLSPHQLQSRFKVVENSVFVLMRKSYTKLKQQVLDLSNYCGIYVRGPAGSGKSYLLYLLAAEYRLNRKNYRVTYINDCAEWRRRPYPYLLEVLVTSFYEDTFGEKSIVELCKDVAGSARQEKLMRSMIDTLFNYIHENNLVWVIICDQYHALCNPWVLHDFPFTLIDIFADFDRSKMKVIVSASADNEGYPRSRKGWWTHYISPFRFDKDEFEEWCDNYLFQNNTKVDDESEEAADALFWTGGIPYELDLVWKQPAQSLTEKVQLYRKQRIREMTESHGKFCDALKEEPKAHLKKCISLMAQGRSPEVLVGMDHQLIVIEEGEDEEKTINALNPVARRSLLSYHLQCLMVPFESITRKDEAYPRSFKSESGGIYITTVLELTMIFPFQYRKIADIPKIGLPGDFPQRRLLKIDAVVPFLTNKLPPKTYFQRNATILFVPEPPKYPGYDFFLWDSERQILMGFQVTTENSFSKHPKMTNSKMRQQFCFGNSKQTPIEMYWIVRKSCTRSYNDAVQNDYIILFEDLSVDFPVLQDFEKYMNR